MARKKKYSRQDVNTILQESEGRKSPVSDEPGHTLQYHVGVGGLQISDRLVNTLKSDASHPIVMTSTGSIAPESVHRDIWKAGNPGMTTKQTKSYYRTMIDNHKSRSGSFLDRQQAINVARYILNSDEGQAKLGELDTSEARVALTMSLNKLDLTNKEGKKMNFASSGGGDSDITHLEDFSKAFILVDRLDAGGIHIQTLFPIK